jgi:hypothetical protein
MIRFEEMANVRGDKTGLSMVIWIFPKTGREKHGARIKVQNSYGVKVSDDWFSVTIDKLNPIVIAGKPSNIKQSDLQKVFDFIKANYQPLIDLWNDKIDPYDCISKFKKV